MGINSNKNASTSTSLSSKTKQSMSLCPTVSCANSNKLIMFSMLTSKPSKALKTEAHFRFIASLQFFILCALLGVVVDSAIVLRENVSYRSISAARYSTAFSDGAPLCYPCSYDNECNTHGCIDNVCARRITDVEVCKRLQRRSGLGKMGRGLPLEVAKKPDCQKCNRYWECESGRCIKNKICAKDAWVYASCLHRARNIARRGRRRRLPEFAENRHRGKQSYDDDTDEIKVIPTDVVSSDALNVITASGGDSSTSSSSKGSSQSKVRYVCATCNTAADCNTAINELCVRNQCVLRVADLYHCVMPMKRRINPRWLGIETVNTILTEGPGFMWKHLVGRRDDCSPCNEWFHCASRRCIDNQCARRKKDLLRCKENEDAERRGGGGRNWKKNKYKKNKKERRLW